MAALAGTSPPAPESRPSPGPGPSVYLLGPLPPGDLPSGQWPEGCLPGPRCCLLLSPPSHPGLLMPGHPLSSSLRHEGPQTCGETCGGSSHQLVLCGPRASRPGRAGGALTASWGLSVPQGPPGSGRHPGSTVCVPVLPDVIVLVVKGLDVVTAAGLEQSRAGLQERPPWLWVAPRGKVATPTPWPPASSKLGTHTVLVGIDGEVYLCNPVKGRAVRTVAGSAPHTQAAHQGDARHNHTSQGQRVL